MAAMTDVARRRRGRHRRARSSTPTGCSPPREGVFCEPASAASVAGLLKHGAGGARAGRLRADRPRPEGPADRARAGRARSCRASPTLGAVEQAVLGVMDRRRLVRVPASSANLGPGFDTLRRRARRCTWSSRSRRPGASRSRPTSQIARDRRNLAVRGFERLHPPDGFTFRIRSDIPLVRRPGLERGGVRRRACMAADHLFELDADLLALATELEGHPDNVAAALLGGFVVCADGARDALRRRRPGSRPCSSCPHEAVRTKQARAALPAEVPMADAVFNIAHGALLMLGLARGDWDLVAPRPRRPPAPAPPRAPVPALDGARASARASSARSARRSPAPARPCSSGCHYEQTGAVVEALRREADGWADVMRAPFEPHGRRRARALTVAADRPDAALAASRRGAARGGTVSPRADPWRPRALPRVDDPRGRRL